MVAGDHLNAKRLTSNSVGQLIQPATCVRVLIGFARVRDIACHEDFVGNAAGKDVDDLGCVDDSLSFYVVVEVPRFVALLAEVDVGKMDEADCHGPFLGF